MASVQNAGVHRRLRAARDLVDSTLFMYLCRCGARDGRPFSQGLRAQAPSPSFTEGTHDFVVLGFEEQIPGNTRLPVR